MELLQDKNRDYQRYRHNARERSFLGLQGLQSVLSSNVSSVGVRGDSLIIRFHNGSMYEYPNQSTKYDDILRSNSKGKWVWRFLRRARVPYQKIGILPLPDDIGITDEEIFQEIDNRYLADLTRHVDVPVFQSFEFIKGLNLQKIVVGNIATYVPITAPLEIINVNTKIGFFDKAPSFDLSRQEFREQTKVFEQKVEQYVQKVLSKKNVFANVDDIEKWSKNNGIVVKELENIDIRIFNEIKEPIEQTLREYPQIKKYYSLYNKNFEIYQTNDDGFIAEADFGFGLPKKYFTNFGEVLKRTTIQKGDGFVVTGDGTFSTVVYHEMGHSLDSYITKMQIDYDYKTKGVYYKENENNKPTDKFLHFMRKNKDRVSEYAKTNSAEFFAESFAEMMSNPDSDFSKEFSSLLDEMLQVVDNFEV